MTSYASLEFPARRSTARLSAATYPRHCAWASAQSRGLQRKSRHGSLNDREPGVRDDVIPCRSRLVAEERWQLAAGAAMTKRDAVTRKRLRLHQGRRGASAPFAHLPVELLTSLAVKTLPHAAHRVLVALAAQYCGRNNGSLSLPRRVAREYGICDPHVLYDALRELEARGLVSRTRPGTRLPPRAALYAIMWREINEPLPSDPHHVRPTVKAPDTWRSWTPAKEVPYWTIRRRAPRWRVPTTASGASPLMSAKMSGASPHLAA